MNSNDAVSEKSRIGKTDFLGQQSRLGAEQMQDRLLVLLDRGLLARNRIKDIVGIVVENRAEFLVVGQSRSDRRCR